VEGNEPAIKALLESGADVNQAAKDGRTSLFFAAQIGHEAAVRRLLEGGADVNRAKEDGTTPLHVAAQEGQEAAVQLLLEGGADVNRATEGGATPLYVAKATAPLLASAAAVERLLLRAGAGAKKLSMGDRLKAKAARAGYL
jgi:ankyrin repeat protein